jgi:hypothetical protein
MGGKAGNQYGIKLPKNSSYGTEIHIGQAKLAKLMR